MPERQRLSALGVVDAAATLADEQGLDDLTLTRVAEELEVQPSALYNHVDGAEGLVAGVSAQATAELLDVVRTAAVGRAGPDALRAMSGAYREYAALHPGRYAATLLPTLPDDKERSDLDAEMTTVIVQVVERFDMSPPDAVHLARAIRSALHGFVSLEATDGFSDQYSVDRSFDRLLDLLCSGLAASA